MRRGVDRTERFLGLVALLSLVVGGVGVAQTVRAWLASRLDSIAVFKALGARPREILAIYLGQTVLLATAGSLAGVVLGLALERLVPSLAGIAPAGAAADRVSAARASARPRPGARHRAALRAAAAPRRARGARGARPPPRGRAVAAVTPGARGHRSGAPRGVDSRRRGAGPFARSRRRLRRRPRRDRRAPRAGSSRAHLRRPPAAAALACRYRCATASPRSVGRARRRSPVSSPWGWVRWWWSACAPSKPASPPDCAPTCPTNAPTAFLIDIQPDQWAAVRSEIERAGATSVDSVPVVMARLAEIDGENSRHPRRRPGESTRGGSRKPPTTATKSAASADAGRSPASSV